MPAQKVLAKKQAQVASLAKELKDAQSIVFSNYQGLTVAQDTEMRAAFRKEGLNYKVVKNNIALRALQELGFSGLEETMKGPIALAYSNEDVVLAPRLVKQFVEKFKKTEIKGGIVENKLAELKTITALSQIPSTEELYGQFVCGMVYPIRSLAITLNLLAEKAAAAGVDTVGALASGQPAEKTAEASAEPKTEEAQTEADKTEEAKAEESSEESAATPAAPVEEKAEPESAEEEAE